jgi:pyruvate/2-oxoacid:ferredoxin oxidoreductase beta subunit/Pyruvate/2-oxoacid:ferredoxin oxidoreductase delta subunit
MTDTIAATDISKLGAGPGLISPQTLDVAAYIEDFNTNVIDAYRRGVADVELPADMGVGRSLIAPATAGTRDFSALSPLIPQFIADKCVGCMACVSACPDSAIFATAQPKSSLAKAIDGFAATQADPTLATETAKSHFVHTTKYADVPAKKGLDPYHCKGCAECVDVCVAQGHDALAMVEKCDAEATGECTLDRYRRDITFYKSLPPTPVEYRNEKVLADIMLGENAFGFVGGGGSCSGCGEGTVVRMVVAATLQTYGPQSMGVVAETGCNTVFASTYPYNPFTIPWTNSLFENGPADAMGVRLRWDQAGHEDRRLWVIGGDGAMYDIGFQSLSRLVASGMDVKVLVLDTGVYSNTGGQASTASFTAQVSKLAAYGKAEHGKSEKRKELGRIMVAHGDVYVAQVAACTINHLYKAVMEANAYPGPAVIIAYAPCMPEHGIPDDAANRQAKLAVDSRAFPLFTYDPRRGSSLAERLSLQGNPAVKEDWTKSPDGSTYDFISFAKTEARFGQHFDKEGNPSVELQRAQEDRLHNWHTLQELAGVLRTPVGH